MTGRIFRSTLIVAVLVLLSTVGVILGVAYRHFDNFQRQQLKSDLAFAAAGVQHYGTDFLKTAHDSRFRLTWIEPDGSVIYDTIADETVMENHLGREEIAKALTSGQGTSTRYSDTLTEKTIYQAMLLEDGTVLRISISSAAAARLVLGMLLPTFIILGISIIFCALLAHSIARRIVRPINSLDLEHPLENDVYSEITPLLTRINRQNLHIRSQLLTLRHRADELQQITENMSEGLVLLDGDGLILSINPAAKRIFSAGDDCLGRDLLALDRSTQMRQAINTAFLQGEAGFTDRRGSSIYHFSAERIISGGTVIGAVVLAVDVTEQQTAEQLRREFSANVSHELKSPLHSILGSAELLESGMVAPEDSPRFIGHIRREAQRLTYLVDDIIRLSQLDEGALPPAEEVELKALAEETVSSLRGAAQAVGVSLEVTGQPCTVTGVRRLLGEVIYNLCDNAIKYNVPGGSVCVSITSADGETHLCVQDTGIGIPAEHHSRIFERFYRVDKSHSRASGGTGLGLSIVKHAVQQHGGRLQLSSTPGEGTSITVILP